MRSRTIRTNVDVGGGGGGGNGSPALLGFIHPSIVIYHLQGGGGGG